MSKNIWIVNEYAGSPEYGMTFRHYYLAKEFVQQGHSVTIITASYSHFLKKFPPMEEKKYYLENIEGVDFLWVKVNRYKEAFDKRRILKWFEFAYRLRNIPKVIAQKPDFIISSPTAPFAAYSTLRLAKKLGAKHVFEVRDIWPLTLVEVGGYSPNHPFIKLMGWFERLALKKSDILVSNLQNYSKHIQKIGINRTAHWVSNGIYTKEMNSSTPLDEEILSTIPKNKFIVGYTGKIGVSNAIEYLIAAAEKLMTNEEIAFVIVGRGQEKSVLQQKAKNLKNVLFVDAIPKRQVQSMLSIFDVCYIGLNKEKLFRYGVSPNKLFDYMHSEKPILYAIDSGANNIVDLANCGITREAENVDAIVAGILRLYNMDDTKRIELGQNGKSYVENHFTYTKLAEKYIAILEQS